MKLNVSREILDFFIVHLVFVLICFITLIIPITGFMGIKLFILVVIYNIIIPIYGYLRKYSEWLNIWLFALLLSLFQIWPDWFLSAELGILVFPEDGFIKIGTVSLYMAGLWAIPVFLIIYTGSKIKKRYSQLITYLGVGILSLLIFGLAEQTMWMLQSWYAQNVIMIGHLALYIIIPEIILGITTYYYFILIQEKKHQLKIPATFIVMVIYLGSAVLFYFIIETILFP
ncbi:MAG: DUF6989 domain-containing protein [Candidatus Hermodarchaeota archaeon]